MKKDKPSKIDWIIYGVLVVVLLINFGYADILATSTHGVSIWDAIFKSGGFLKFYEINADLVIRGMTASAAYDLPIYLIFGIWDFPLWVLKELTGIVLINNAFAIIWMKLLPLIFLGGCAYLVKKICEDININKNWIKWVVFIFLTCPLISTSVIFIGQYDVIAMFFILLGIRAYIKDDINKFVIWFMIAIPMKLFALFILLPLLLIKEKNYIKTIAYTGISLLFLIICKIIQFFMPTYGTVQNGFNSGMANRILEGKGLDLYLGSAPYFIVVFIALCIYCYYIKPKTKEETNKLTIWACFVTYASFMVLCYSYPYWVIYFIPFMIIMMFQNTKNFKINFILETIMCLSVILIQTYKFSWCYTNFTMQHTLIPTITGNTPETFHYLKSFIDKLPYNIIPSLMAIWLVCSVALAIINFPRKNTETNKVEIDKILLYLRIAFPLFLAIVLIVKFIGV